MNPERLQRIRGTYEGAVDSLVAARQALLERECEGDEDLRREVERLLGAWAHLPKWLGGPVLAMAQIAALQAHSTVTQPPTDRRPFYATAALLGIATLAALALYGFVTTLSGRSARLADS